MRVIFLRLALLVWLWPCSAGAADPPPPLAPQSPWGQLFKELFLASVPTEYEEQPGWGATKEFTVGVKVDTHDWQIETRRRKKPLNHGLWKHYRVALVDPEHKFSIRVEDVRLTPEGRYAFTAVVAAQLHGFARHSRWRRGVQTYSISAEAEAGIELWLTGDVATKVVPDGYSLAAVVEPRINSVDIRLVNFQLLRLSKIDGWAADELGAALQDIIADKLDKREPKLVEKLNRSIAKRQDKLKLSLDDLMRRVAPSSEK